jgi:hypothetical protein
MNNYTNNGIANLASYGRGNDTELVHMTPGEVKGLQALAMAHGGSLTINPDTGLVEAGFLEQILPVVAAAGLTYLTAGAATPLLTGALGATGAGIVAGAGAGAAISGGMAAIQGKDVGQAALMGGFGGAVAGGLGAYGDANVFGVGAADTAAQTGVQASTSAVPSGITAGGDGISGGASMVPTPTPASGMPTGGDGISGGASMVPQNVPVNPGMELTSSMVPQNVPVNPGISLEQGQKLASAPASSYYAGLQPDQYIQKAGIQALPVASLLEEKQNIPGGEEDDEYTRRLKGYRLSPNYKAYEAPRPDPYYRPVYAADGGVMESFDDEAGSDTVGMASGGIARYRSKGQVNVLQDYLDRQDREEAQKQKHLSTNPSSYFPDVGIFRDTDVDTARKDALTASMIRLGKIGKGAGIKPVALPKTSIKGLGDIRGATPEVEEAADGGIMRYNLGGYSDGGRMLKGPGDGMSDSIPASIAGKQPARLADGEFVVPADVVSHLGNGSTDAGAKKLYGMMDKIRKARTGKKKQAPQVNVDKYLPMNKKASGGIAGYAEGGITGYNTGGPTFSDAQVASYFQGNASTPAQQAEAMAIFGVSQAQADRANALISAGDPGIAAANAAYNASIAANPSQAAANAQFVASQQAALAAGQPTYVSTLSPAPVTPVTPVTPAPVNKNTTGPGGYTIPFFPPEAIASYLKEHKVTTQPQIDQLKLIFNVNDAQITAAQNLIRDNPTLVDATTAKYRTDIAANPAQEAQNARDLQARMTQLGITTPLIPIVPIKPVTPVTPESTTTTGPLAGSNVYRPGFVPRTAGINNMPASVRDPYSDEGLKVLYGQMMNQYNKPAPSITDEQVRDVVRQYVGNGAEVGRQLINRGVPVNQTIAALKGYSGITPEIVNQSYLGGQALGTATPPPTLDTQYAYSDPATYYRPPAPNNLILTKPIVDAAFKAPAPASDSMALPAAVVAERTGGLLSIDRKKRAKTKPKKGLLAA